MKRLGNAEFAYSPFLYFSTSANKISIANNVKYLT
jgi:hypothetical protein